MRVPKADSKRLRRTTSSRFGNHSREAQIYESQTLISNIMIARTKSHADATCERCVDTQRRRKDESKSMLSEEEDCFSYPAGSEEVFGAIGESESEETSWTFSAPVGTRSCITSISTSRQSSSPQSDDRSSPSSPDAWKGNSASERRYLDTRAAELEEKFRKAFSHSMKASRKTSRGWARRGSSGSLLQDSPFSPAGEEARADVRGWGRVRGLARNGCFKAPEDQSAKQVAPPSAWTKGRNTVTRPSVHRNNSMTHPPSSPAASHSDLPDTSGKWSHPCSSFPTSRSSAFSRSGSFEVAETSVTSGLYLQSKQRRGRTMLLIPLTNGDLVDTILVMVSVLMLVLACGTILLQNLSVAA